MLAVLCPSLILFSSQSHKEQDHLGGRGGHKETSAGLSSSYSSSGHPWDLELWVVQEGQCDGPSLPTREPTGLELESLSPSLGGVKT